MIRLALLRHGPTSWNAERRIQGHTDVPLSQEGRAAVALWRLPEEAVATARPFVSPLARARETADLLGLEGAVCEPRLREMHWGEWEGQRLGDLRRQLGEEMAAREALGFDFRPPGGESPRELLARLRSWLAEIEPDGKDVVAVTHKGVIRTLFAAATDWNLVGDPPSKIRPACLHSFRVGANGRIEVERMNLPLTAETGS
jgi:probable phosphoglycerate mutase